MIATDPFYFGESKISKRDFLFALLCRPSVTGPSAYKQARSTRSHVGERPCIDRGVRPADQHDRDGRRSAEPRPVKTHEALSSLRDVIEKNMAVGCRARAVLFRSATVTSECEQSCGQFAITSRLRPCPYRPRVRRAVARSPVRHHGDRTRPSPIGTAVRCRRPKRPVREL